MTIAEKIKMYKEKKAFIDNISKAFEAKPSGSTVASIDYEVYRMDMEDGRVFFEEYLIVNFFGGGKSVRVANGNSNIANFRALGALVEGGYYDEIRRYETLEDVGFKLVQLSNKDKLNKLLAKPMTHISDVRACFSYCQNRDDVERVISMIPKALGSFELDFINYDTDEDTFTIIHSMPEYEGVSSVEVFDYFYPEEV